jgi:hypothetical protein
VPITDTLCHTNIAMVSRRELPQEIWDIVTSHLPSCSACNVAKVFGFTISAYDKVWSSIFMLEDWHECPAGQGADIVLIGADLDILGSVYSPNRPHVVLAVFDRGGDLQWEEERFRLSFGKNYNGPGVYELEHLTLTIGNFDVPEIYGQDFRFLFSQSTNHLHTKYCYWGDPRKTISTVARQDIRGVGGVITTLEDLDSIFLLHLHPPLQRRPRYFPPSVQSYIIPEQFIFKKMSVVKVSNFTLAVSQVDVIFGEKMSDGS